MAKKGKVPVPYDNEQCKELAELVEVLTHSGQKTLDTNQLKKLNDIWTTSDKFVEYIYKLIIHQLEKDHSEIRYSAFQLCTEIFRQSENFRNLVVDNLDDILLLTAETDLDFPLPQPLSTAVELKKLALTTLNEWNKEYGSTYKRIVLGFNYLQRVKKVDFNALQLQSDAERAREREKERRLEAVNKERIKKVENEVNEFNNDITTAVKSLNSCLDLLLPKPEEFFISLEDNESIKETPANNEIKKNTAINDDDDDDTSEDEMDCEEEGHTSLREFGAVNIKHSVEVNIKLDEVNCLKETAENEAVIENARDHVKLIRNSYLPRCKGWLQILTKASGNVSLLKRIMDLKMSMEQLLGKYERLNITKDTEDDCVSTDSELEEVKESEDGILKPKTKTKKYVKKQEDRSQWNILSNDENPNDPTTIHSSIATLHNKKSPTKTNKDKNPVSSTKKATKVVDEPKPSTSKDVDYSECSTSTGVNDRKKKLLAIAPKLPFDIDLYHWEDDKLNPPTILPTCMDTNKFWSSASGESIMEVVVPEGSSALRTRVIEFAGEFTPVSRSCRAPLSNGKLCPRLDRYKCPFHGVIVPRDEMGKCVDPKDEQTKAAEEEKKVPEWQDPALLNDIKLATGIDLKIPEKKGKGKRKKEKKYPGLTDLKAKQNTARNRLAKKIFKKSAMKRVASTLDNIEHRRFRDKYGDQFHYMYDTA